MCNEFLAIVVALCVAEFGPVGLSWHTRGTQSRDGGHPRAGQAGQERARGAGRVHVRGIRAQRDGRGTARAAYLTSDTRGRAEKKRQSRNACARTRCLERGSTRRSSATRAARRCRASTRSAESPSCPWPASTPIRAHARCGPSTSPRRRLVRHRRRPAAVCGDAADALIVAVRQWRPR